ncbi:MAG: tyrosine-type recombinase/integrase [Dehalococcoidia bacterium]|nr:tyrosine-type recombinase/integrase [Dehalococcoidia bacterium]
MSKTYLEVTEVELLEKQATNLRDILLVRLLFHLGCRISEALALTPQDIDLDQSTVTILHLKSRERVFCPQCNARLGKSHSFCPGCGKQVEGAVKKELEHRRVRTLPLDKGTLDMLREYIKRKGPIKQNGRVMLFGINRHRAWQVIKELAQRAGLPRLVHPESGREHGVSPHRLRDAFAVMAVKQNDSGDGLRLLQEHLGHTSFNTTARYRKVSGQEHQEWYEKLWGQKDGAGPRSTDAAIPGNTTNTKRSKL